MNRKITQGNIITALVTAMATLIIVFIGPFRNMASANDIKDFVTSTEVKAMIPASDNRYAEDRSLLMNYLARIDKLSNNIATLSSQVVTLTAHVDALKTEVANLRLRASAPITTNE